MFQDDWDDFLDDEDLEDCIMKETEILSQVPKTQQMKKNENFPNTSNTKIFQNKQNKQSTFINDKFNDFATKQDNNFGTSNSNSTPSKSRNPKYGKIPLEVNNSSSFKMPTLPSVLVNTVDKCVNEVKENSNSLEELKLLQRQLDLANQEKEKLIEENQIKQGEVCNLRLELKRKESCLETERIDQCIALEEAEKRGKDKATKTISELDLKTKALQKELDRIQGNLGFKDREINELLLKCKHLEQIKGSPGKKLKNASPNGSKLSPSKFSSNFADRFDFGGRKQLAKDAQVQTEICKEKLGKPSIKVLSRRGCPQANRKAFFISVASQQIDHISQVKGEAPLAELIKSDNYSTLLAQMAFTHKSTPAYSSVSTTTSNCEHLLVKSACRKLERTLQKLNQESSVGNTSPKQGSDTEEPSVNTVVPIFNILSVAHAADDTISQNALKLISLYLLSLTLKEKNLHEIISAGLDSISFLAGQSTHLPIHLCETIRNSLKHCCQLSSKAKYTHKMFSTLNILFQFENFKSQICKNLEPCLLSEVCKLLQCQLSPGIVEDLNNEAVAFVAQLFQCPTTWMINKQCSCASILPSAFLNYLYSMLIESSSTAAKGKLLHQVLCGVRVLHLLQVTDNSWWEKASNLPTYSALLSSLLNKCKDLKADGNIDQHTINILYELYEVDQNAICS